MNSHALPESPLGQRLWDTFGRYPWAWIYKEDGKDVWKTEKRYPLRPRLMWKHWQDAAMQLGIRFGSTTSYAMIDIDSGSEYLRGSAIADIQEALETIGIVRTVTLRSSWSGGLHIYIPLPEPVKTFNLAVAVKSCMEAHGFTVSEGQMEIFPNTKAFGRSWLKEFVEYQGHRLPLQPGSGSVLLNHSLQPMGDNLDRFWWGWDFAAQAQDVDLLAEALSTAKNNRRKHRRLMTKLEEWRTDLEAELAEGWTGHGQTNHLLKAIATHGRVFLGLAGELLTEYVRETAIASTGFNAWCRHTHEIGRKALRWAISVESYYFPSKAIGAQVPDLVSGISESNQNEKKRTDTSVRISMACIQLERDHSFQPKGISDWVKALVERLKISTRTLYKHKELWHPRCKTPYPDWLRDLLGAPETPSEPPSPTEPKPALHNGFLHLGGGMKGPQPENRLKENLSPGEIGGCGGEERFSTGFAGG